MLARFTIARRRAELIEGAVLVLVGALGLVIGARAHRPAEARASSVVPVVPPPGGWPAMPAHAEGVTKYVLEAKLDPVAHTIAGKGTITLRNAAAVPLRELRMHLYLNAFKNDRTVFRRARVAGFRGSEKGEPGYIDVKRLVSNGKDLWPKRELVPHAGDFPQDPLRKGAMPPVPPVEGAPDDETDVRVPLAEPLAPGASLTLEVEFEDKLPKVSERTGFEGTFHFAGQWFPKLAKLEKDGSWASFPFHHLAEFHADYGSYDVTVDVPEAYTIGAVGPTLSTKVENGRRIERHAIDDVHDFAFTAWDRFVVKESSEGGVAIRHLGPPGYERAAAIEIESVRHALRDKNARFGEYPYPLVTIVHPPEDAEEAGGMEYPTLITTGGPWWSPSVGLHWFEDVTIHEFGHQWFYGLVATHEVEWPAGDEGFNSFGDHLALATMFGSGSAVSIGPYVLSSEVFSHRGMATAFDEPIFQPAPSFANGRSYGSRVYGATSMVLLTLRRVFDPQRFDWAMGIWTRTMRFRHPKPEDFLALLGREVSPECERAARLAFTTPFSYDVYVESISSEKEMSPAGYFDGPGGREKKVAKETGRFTNIAFIGRRGLLDVPVDVELRFADGKTARRTIRFPTAAIPVTASTSEVLGMAIGVQVGAVPDGPMPTADQPSAMPTWYRIDADGPTELVSVTVDPDGKLLVDRNRLDNFASTSKGRGGAPVARERALAWIGTLARWVGP